MTVSCARVVDRAEDVDHAKLLCLPPDWLFYFEALERSMLNLVETPLASTNPECLQDLKRFLGDRRDQTTRLVRRACLEGSGTQPPWLRQ